MSRLISNGLFNVKEAVYDLYESFIVSIFCGCSQLFFVK